MLNAQRRTAHQRPPEPMASTNVRSRRRNQTMPLQSRTAALSAETVMTATGGVPWPSSAHRKPSTTPTMGLHAYASRQMSGTRLLGYTTGVRNNQSCVANGTAYITSRYSTFSAESQKPTPSADASSSKTTAGSHSSEG